jgi:hypothetical protein
LASALTFRDLTYHASDHEADQARAVGDVAERCFRS